MSYFPKGHHAADDDVDDFEEYDATPYGGGYDITLTYGRPLPPSEETCYPRSFSAGSDDYDLDRPQYDSGCEPSAYADQAALDDEYQSYARPKPRPAPQSYGAPEPGYGERIRPGGDYGGESDYVGGGGSEYGRKPQYGESYPDPDYGSGYGRKPDFPDQESEYGGKRQESGYGRRPEYEQPPPSEYGSGSEYGRRPDYQQQPGSEYGSGYGYGRGPEYQQQPPVSEYERPSSEEYGGYGYGRKSNYPRADAGEEGFGSGGYGEYNREEISSNYGRAGYRQTVAAAEYERPSYGRSEEEDYRKPRCEGKRDDDEEEGYHRKKYGDNDDDDDEEEDEEKNRRRHHHHRKHYDD